MGRSPHLRPAREILYALLFAALVVVIGSFGGHLRHRPFGDQILPGYFAWIGFVGMRYQIPNAVNAVVNLRAFRRLTPDDAVLIHLARDQIYRGFIRLSAQPLMLVVGVLALFAIVPLPNLHPDPLTVLAGVILLMAIVWQETAFTLLAILDYAHMGPIRFFRHVDAEAIAGESATAQ